MSAKRAIILFVTILLLAVAPAGIVFLPIAAASTTTVGISPSTVNSTVGQIFSVNVTILVVSDLYSWEYKISWNSSLIEVVSASEGPFLKHEGSTFFSYNVNATAGKIVVDCTLLGNVPGVNGNGTLSTIAFRVKNSGQCPLDFYEVTLLNEMGQSIPNQDVNGYGYFLEAPDIAVTGVVALPLLVVEGGIVKVNVTVANQGGVSENFNVTAKANNATIGTQHVALNGGTQTVAYFSWNTGSFAWGDYVITGIASLVPGEVNTGNNNKTANNEVTVLYSGHQIAVTSILPSKNIIGEGTNVTVEVAVKDFGIYSEAFSTRLYVNGSSLAIQNVNLSSGSNVTLIFHWTTNSYAKGAYNITAYAPPISGEGSTTHNQLSDTVILTIIGDVNGDRTVNVLDLVLMASHLGQVGGGGYAVGSAMYWQFMNCDLNSDGAINVLDLIICAGQAGQSW